MPDRELLLKARDDLEKVILISPSLQAYVDIGQVSIIEFQIGLK